MKSIASKYYSLIPTLLLCVFYIYKAIDFPIHDFSNYYFGGNFLADGNFNTNIYFPYWFNKEIASLGYSGLFCSYAPNSPFLALLFYPSSFLTLASAKLIFNCLSVLLFIYSLKRLINFYNIKTIYIVLIPLLFFVPIKNELLFGQVYFLLFFLLSECFLAYEKEQFKKMAFFLSLAILLKVFPVVLLLLFVFKKQFKPLLNTFVFCLSLFGISLLFIPLNVWFFYLNSVLPKASNGEIASAYVDNYQSVFMFLKRLLVFDSVENSKSLFNYPMLFTALILAFKVGIITIGFYISKRISNTLAILSFWILAMILLSPYGSTYTFILMLFPYFYLAKADITTAKKGMFIGLLFLINNLTLSYFIHLHFPFSYLRLLFLGLFFSWFIWLFFKAIQWKWVGLASVVSLLFAFFVKENNVIKSNHFTIIKFPILIYDYAISNKQLTYFYWNENGENQQNITLCKSNCIPLELKNNQIFYHKKQLTFDNSNKLKPVLFNGKVVVYLSDYDRGNGFYTFRKIIINSLKNE